MKKEEITGSHNYFACINGVWERITTCRKPISDEGHVRYFGKGFNNRYALFPDDLVDVTDEKVRNIIEKREQEEKEQQERNEKELKERIKEERKKRISEEGQKIEFVRKFYGIAPEATIEEIENQVFRNLHVPTYGQFKESVFDYIKAEGIHDTKEHIEEAFNPDSYLFKYTDYDYQPLVNTLSQINKSGYGLYERSLLNDLEELFYNIVGNMNYLGYLEYLVDYEKEDEADVDEFLEKMFDISIGAYMPKEYDDRNPDSLLESYFERLEKEDMQELKDIIMSLAK